MTKEKISYSDAIAKIESILQMLEDGKLTVDELSEKVSQVTDLIKLCRDRLYLTEKQINKTLEDEEAGSP